MRHHTGKWYSLEDRPRSEVERIVAFADSLAAGADRREEAASGGSKLGFPVEITHVLSEGNVVRRSFDQASLAYISNILLRDLREPCRVFKGDSERGYREIYDVLEASQLRWVPADTREPVNDVSLWDHLKLTAAFATCIFLGGGYAGDRAEKYEFSLVSGDADKVSEFVNVSSRLPDLHARSKIVRKATEAVSAAVSEVLGPECVLFAGGGSYLVLAPISLSKKVMDAAEKAFEQVTQGKVTISSTFVQVSGEEVRQSFGEVWGRAREMMRLKKSGRMLVPPVSAEEGEEVCDVCGLAPWKFEDETKILRVVPPRPERLCAFCWETRELGRRGIHIELEKLGEKSGFVGLLKADGDDVGELLRGRRFADFGKVNTPSRLSTLSGLIHGTCEEDLDRVIRESRGETVFAGGDDVLALLPGEQSLEAAKAVYLKFREAMAEECTMSAGLAIFHRRLPIYAALEAASHLLNKAKNDGKNRIAYAVIGGVGLISSEIEKVPSRTWEQVGVVLEIVDAMRKSGVAASQLRKIARASLQNRVMAEALIKNLMGRTVIGWVEGKRYLSLLETGLLGDAYLIYNLFKGD